jgi:ribonuclease HI
MSQSPQHVLHFDGGSRGNPGPAGIGMVLRLATGKIIRAEGRFIGFATNNVAEYQAVVAGLEMALEAGLTSLEVRGDSELVIRQLTGVYKVRHPDLIPLHAKATGLMARIPQLVIRHNLREHNALADELANRAMDARETVVHVAPEATGKEAADETPQMQGVSEAFAPASVLNCPMCKCQIRVTQPPRVATKTEPGFICPCGTPMKPSRDG